MTREELEVNHKYRKLLEISTPVLITATRVDLPFSVGDRRRVLYPDGRCFFVMPPFRYYKKACYALDPCTTVMVSVSDMALYDLDNNITIESITPISFEEADILIGPTPGEKITYDSI